MHQFALAGLAAIGVVAAASGATAQSTLPAAFVVPNGPTTGAGGITFNMPMASNGTALNLTVSGISFLQPLNTYGTNAAGVVVVPGTVNTGGSLIDGGSGFTYGALLVTLNAATAKNPKTVQLFPTSVANGFGSATPPASLTYTGTIGQLFSIPDRQYLAFANLTFRVDDSGYSDNSGGFLVTNNAAVAAVPEPATWAMMLAGFGMIGFGLRRRSKQTARITYA